MAGRNGIDRESKSDRFIRVAERRTSKVLKELRLLGQCANRRTYDYSPDQVRRIFREIRRNLGAVEKKFEETEVKPQFKLR
jgi:chorismate mutase